MNSSLGFFPQNSLVYKALDMKFNNNKKKLIICGHKFIFGGYKLVKGIEDTKILIFAQILLICVHKILICPTTK